MATSATSVSDGESRSQGKSSSWMKVVLPYAIAIGVQLPMLILYFRGLWSRPHYQTFVFGILAVVAIAWSRWPKGQSMPFHKSRWSNFLLFAGLIFGLAGIVFLETWFHACSVFLLVASFLARTMDEETGKSMWAVALPLFVFLRIPAGGDYQLITWLQRISAVFTSRLLDLIGYAHHMPGTVIKIPGKEDYGIEQACSGVQSFFTLLFVAVVFIVWNRRPWFRAMLLIAAAVFWAIFMNTVRIFAIPVADRVFEIDLAHGLAHDILGWTVMTIGILLLFSTDQFLLFLFGPVDAETGKTGPFGNLFTNIWNGILAGDLKDEDKSKRKRRGRRPISAFGNVLMWATAGILLVCSLWQMGDVWRSFNAPRALNVQFFDSDSMYPGEENDLPPKVDDWTLVKDGYKAEDRKRGSDLGLRSDSWEYESPRCKAVASFDQTFPGWHELTICYRNVGWTLVDRIKREATIESEDDENGESWPYIEAHFEMNTGEKGFLLFSDFDAFGKPFDAPSEWGTINSFILRAQNRLSHKIRARLFHGEAYQTQVFVSSFADFDESLKAEITEKYLKIREMMRQSYKEKKGATGAEVASL